eukprot:351444-Pyramimonas_sp.AAC.1
MHTHAHTHPHTHERTHTHTDAHAPTTPHHTTLRGVAGERLKYHIEKFPGGSWCPPLVLEGPMVPLCAHPVPSTGTSHPLLWRRTCYAMGGVHFCTD